MVAHSWEKAEFESQSNRRVFFMGRNWDRFIQKVKFVIQCASDCNRKTKLNANSNFAPKELALAA